MGDLFPDDDWDPYNGFNRASVIFWSRKPYHPKPKADDLLTPRGFGNARLAGMCLVMAICMTLLYVWPVLFFVNFWIPLRGHLYGGAFVSAVIAFLLFMYFAGTRETRRDRELAARL